jgi:hypothetical protein
LLALAAHLAQELTGGSSGDGFADSKDPDALFLVQPYSAPAGTKYDAVFRAFQFERITRAELHFVADGLGQDDAAGFVEG